MQSEYEPVTDREATIQPEHHALPQRRTLNHASTHLQTLISMDRHEHHVSSGDTIPDVDTSMRDVNGAEPAKGTYAPHKPAHSC